MDNKTYMDMVLGMARTIWNLNMLMHKVSDDVIVSDVIKYDPRLTLPPSR